MYFFSRRTLFHHGADVRQDDDHNRVRHVTATGNVPVEKRPKATEDDQLRRGTTAVCATSRHQAGNHMDECRVHHSVTRLVRILFLQLFLHHEMANLLMG